MKKLIIVCILALINLNSYAQYDETFSNDWGTWENCNDFDQIKFRIKGNYVKGQMFRFVDIQFKNEYETGVYFYYFAKDLLGNENSITNQGHWNTLRLNKGETKEASSVRLGYDEESLDIYIGGVYFSGTSKSEPPGMNSKFSKTYPGININSVEQDLCLYCTLFKNNKLYCPQGKDSDMSDPWSAYGTASLGRKITREQALEKNAALENFANSKAGTAVIVGGSAFVIGKGISEVVKMNRKDRKAAEQTVRNNPSAFRRYEGETDDEVVANEKKRDRRNRLFTAGIGVLVGVGMITYFTLSPSFGN